MSTEEQRRFFERIASRYDNRFCRARWPRNQRLKARVIAEALGAEALEGSIVELGCGTAQVAEYLLEAHPRLHYVGLDLSPAMLEIARGRLARFGERVELRAVSDDLPLAPVAAAGAFGVDVLHHVDEPVDVLRKLREALAPGAEVVFLEGNPRFPLTALIGLLHREERGLFRMTPRNLATWLRSAGFADARVELGPLYTPPGPRRLEPVLDRIDDWAGKAPGLRSLALFYTAAARAPGG